MPKFHSWPDLLGHQADGTDGKSIVPGCSLASAQGYIDHASPAPLTQRSLGLSQTDSRNKILSGLATDLGELHSALFVPEVDIFSLRGQRVAELT